MTGKISMIAMWLLVGFSVQVLTSAQSPNDRYPINRDGKLGFIDYQGKI